MARRHKPTMISVAHEQTREAEAYRERARPVPTPPPPAEPSAWEATSEPAPQPVKLPPHGRPPRAIYIKAPAESGSVVLPPSEARAVKRMFDEALKTTNDPETKKKLRAAQAQLSQRTTRPHGV